MVDSNPYKNIWGLDHLKKSEATSLFKKLRGAVVDKLKGQYVPECRLHCVRNDYAIFIWFYNYLPAILDVIKLYYSF